MLEMLKEKVCEANKMIQKNNLGVLSWGNASERDVETGLIVIKPSGVAFSDLKPNDMVVVDINGKVVEGNLNPSSDTPTHLEIYSKHPEIRGICHTHSQHATAWAQGDKSLDCFGTTHADHFYGSIPLTRSLTLDEIKTNYELNTGVVINETFVGKNVLDCPGIFVKNHGPFTFGIDSLDAVTNSLILEFICGLAFETLAINPNKTQIEKHLMEKHFFRKHGPNSYYGQKKK